MRPLLSEFSYGYALTEELAGGALGGLTAAPVFPSLFHEGQVGGGYDLALPLAGVPLYVQFKLSDHMVYRSAAEWSEFHQRYYRMHLRPQRYSEQHRMLCDLEAGGNEVYYIAPYFHTSDELNMFYAFRTVAGNSVWFNPLGIGYVDDDDHYVAFDRVLPYGLVCSEEPTQTKHKLDTERVGAKLRNYVERAKRQVDRQFFTTVAEDVLALPQRQQEAIAYLRGPQLQRPRETLSQEAQFAAFVTRSVLDAELFVVSLQNQ